MSDTPRTDAASHGFVQANPLKTDVDMWGIPCVDADFARSLERELSQVTAERDEAWAQRAIANEASEKWMYAQVAALNRAEAAEIAHANAVAAHGITQVKAESRILSLEGALRELVTVSDLLQAIEEGDMENLDAIAEYEKRAPLAWSVARRILDV